MATLRDNLIHFMKYHERIPEDGKKELMQKILAGYSGIGWEIGPDPTSNDRITLSLTAFGDGRRLEQLTRDLSLPIESSDWAIVSGIPPRAWERYFEIDLENGGVLGIEGDDWRWRSIGTGQKMEIELIVPVELKILGKQIADAASILLAGELGERNFSDRIKVRQIKFRSELEPENELLPIRTLKKRFVSSYPDCDYSEYLSR